MEMWWGHCTPHLSCDGESGQAVKTTKWKGDPERMEYFVNESSSRHPFLKQNRLIDVNNLLWHVTLISSNVQKSLLQCCHLLRQILPEGLCYSDFNLLKVCRLDLIGMKRTVFFFCRLTFTGFQEAQTNAWVTSWPILHLIFQLHLGRFRGSNYCSHVLRNAQPNVK